MTARFIEPGRSSMKIKSKKKPLKISVLTPSYNSAQFIERAIRSVMSQDYDRWEHIVIDGGSTDGTVEILKKYPHIRWVSGPDRGQSDAMNKAFAMSTGDIIGYLNADDEYFDHTFRVVSGSFSKDPAPDIIVGDIKIIKGDKCLIRKPVIQYDEIVQHFNYPFPNNPVGYFYRRHVQEKTGPFPLNNHYTMDYWFLLEAFRSFRAEKTGHLFGAFHISDSNKTSTINPVPECRRCVEKHLYDHKDFMRLAKYYYNYYKWRKQKI